MKKKILFKLFAIIVAFCIVFAVFFYNSSRLVVKVGAEVYKSKIMAISYDAIESSFNDKEELNKLILIEKDNNNNINFISTNTYRINKLAIEVSKKFKKNIQQEFDKGIFVPLGAFFGIDLFSGVGKLIKVKLISISYVKCDFVSDFKEMGINQTRHILYLKVNSQARVFCNRKSKIVESKISIILFDNLIIGKVPNTYLNGKILGSGIS